MMLSISACAGGSAPAPDGCPGFRPISPDAGFEERWTRSEKEQVLTHNEQGESRGCW